jgi:hypothetical protein
MSLFVWRRFGERRATCGKLFGGQLVYETTAAEICVRSWTAELVCAVVGVA